MLYVYGVTDNSFFDLCYINLPPITVLISIYKVSNIIMELVSKVEKL